MRYQKKTVMVEAFQWQQDMTFSEYPDWFKQKVNSNDVISRSKWLRLFTKDELYSTVRPADYIICEDGELYSCKPDIFEEKYVKVSDTERISPDDIGNDIHEFLHGGDK